MKTQLVAALLLIALAVQIPYCILGNPPIVSLEEALQKGQVKMTLQGAPPTETEDWVNAHVGPCLELALENLHGQPLTVYIEAGRLLASADTSVQTMLVTKPATIEMAARGTQKQPLYAMCTEKWNGSPGPDEFFVLRQLAKPDLRGLAELIAAKDYQTTAGQDAVWVITDDQALSSIWSADVEEMTTLREYVSKVTGKQLEETEAATARRNPAPRYFISFNGNLLYPLKERSTVSLRLYDAQDSARHVFFENKTQDRGLHDYKYQLERFPITAADIFYLRLERTGGELVKERILDFRR